jgi:hypothetical protein
MLNAGLAYGILDHIKANPHSWNQLVWVNECGTVACFAGWACLLSGDKPSGTGMVRIATTVGGDAWHVRGVEGRAMKLLGLESYSEADKVFGVEIESLAELESRVLQTFGPRPESETTESGTN